LQCRDQGDRAVGEQGDVLDAQVLAQRLFQLLMEGAIVGELLALPDFFQVRDELVQGRQIGLRDVNLFRIRAHRSTLVYQSFATGKRACLYIYYGAPGAGVTS